MKKPLAMFIAGLIAGAVVTGGVGVVSAVTSNEPPIVACADKKSGAMRYSAKGKCKKSERKLSLQAPTSLSATQVAGPKGDTGATGPKGDTGSTGATGPSGTGLNTVPVSFGSKTLIQTEKSGCCDFGNSNLYVRAAFRNQTGSAFYFGGSQQDNYQLWLKYFNDSGEEIGCGYGCTYSPGDTLIYAAPTCVNVPPAHLTGDPTFTFELALKNVHAEAPVGARYFSIYFRAQPESGQWSPNYDLPLIDFTATPTEEIISSGSIHASAPIAAAC